ncbi:DUF4397 domain-containing protein [Arthrobacter sp. YAF34]|uniref:DUF4397 domain-containing protein n=1 Tax=Arthrobacter sp. YAF34 TaxID=3233083 RepID=UPI003F8DF70A
MRKKLSAVAGAMTLLAALTLAAPAQAGTHHRDEGTAKLSVLHGVPGLTVDVWLDGKRALDNFKPGTLAGPLNVPDGDHKIAITGANATSAANPVIGPVTVDLEAGQDYTAVAHLAANGKPTATLFTNDTSASPDGKGKLTVRHVAAAPAVDVLAGKTAVIKGLINPHQKTLTLKAGTVSASVAAAGTTAPLIGPAHVKITAGKNTIVYAWGSLAAKNLKVAVQVVNSSSQGDGCDDE